MVLMGVIKIHKITSSTIILLDFIQKNIPSQKHYKKLNITKDLRVV